jgi:DNA (cytosine-5)-methyltransferase 1
MERATQILNQALEAIQQPNWKTQLMPTQETLADIVIENAESQKAVFAVLVTSLVKKIETSTQDIRQHRAEFENGYSGRTYDTKFITPFLQIHFRHFAMSESGWLTRSLEQPHPYTFSYPGKIGSKGLKTTFLEILHDIEENQAAPQAYLEALLYGIWQLQLSVQNIPSATLTDKQPTIAGIMIHLHQHFNFDYRVRGASQLPVMALYSLYELMMDNLVIYKDKQLRPLKSHTSADSKSKSVGDIEIVNADGTLFEAVEVKHNKPIDLQMVYLAYDKLRITPIRRMLLLTTSVKDSTDKAAVNALVHQIWQEHGCDVIVNSAMFTIKYALRTLPNTQTFIERYTQNLVKAVRDNTQIKQAHLDQWTDYKF